MTNQSENEVDRLIRQGEAAVELYLKAKGTARVSRLRDCLDAYNKNRDDFPNVVLALAVELAEARDQYGGDDKAFGKWLVETGNDDLGYSERAAFINIGRYPELSRRILQETTSRSIQRIWEYEIKPILPSARKGMNDPPKSAEPTQTTPSTPAESTPAESKKAEEKSGDTPVVNKRHSFYGFPKAEDVAAIYLNGKMRSLISGAVRAHGGKDVWKLIVEALDAGLLRPTDVELKQLTLKVLFPNAPMTFTRNFLLADKKDRERVRNDIFPAAIANRDQVLAAPDQLPIIVREYTQRKYAEAESKRAEEKAVKARAAMPANQREVILFGKRFWPLVESNPNLLYEYDQIVAAAWFFDDAYRMAKQTPDNSPKSCGIKIRHMMKWLVHYLSNIPDDQSRSAMRQVIQLVVDITRAMETAPETEHANLRPDMPNLDRPYQD